MIILQKPEGYCFEKNIPDIILQKENTEVSVVFAMRIGGITLLSESYIYDVDGYVTIRKIDEIISPYLEAETLQSNGVISTYGLSKVFTFSLNAVDYTFTAVRCEADMPSGLNAETFLKQNFLTRLPREKRTATNRNEYLSFNHIDLLSEVTVRYKVVYLINNERTEKSGILFTSIFGSVDRLVTFNASLATLRTAAALPTEKILQYDLWFTEVAHNIESNAFTFLVDDNHYRDKKHFVFENAFGVLETFTATGIAENKITNDYNLANIQSRYRKTTQDFVSEKTANTGFLSADEMEWLNDLLLSYNVAIYKPGITGMSEEITLTAHDKTDTEANVLQAFKFNYRRAKNNHLQFEAAAKGIFDQTFDSTFN